MKAKVGISKDVKLQIHLKRHEAEKIKNPLQENLWKFLIAPPDDSFLLIKVTLIFGLYSAYHSEELRELNMEDIKGTGSILVVKC